MIQKYSYCNGIPVNGGFTYEHTRLFLINNISGMINLIFTIMRHFSTDFMLFLFKYTLGGAMFGQIQSKVHKNDMYQWAEMGDIDSKYFEVKQT